MQSRSARGRKPADGHWGRHEVGPTGFVRDDNPVRERPVGVTAPRDRPVRAQEDGNDAIWRVARLYVARHKRAHRAAVPVTACKAG